MMIVTTSCNILYSSYTVDALLKAFRMRKCIHKIPCQQHYDDSKQNHKRFLLPFSPVRPVGAGTIPPAAKSGQSPPAACPPSKDPSSFFSPFMGKPNPCLVHRFSCRTKQHRTHQYHGNNQNPHQQIRLHKTYPLSSLYSLQTRLRVCVP